MSFVYNQNTYTGVLDPTASTSNFSFEAFGEDLLANDLTNPVDAADLASAAGSNHFSNLHKRW